MGRIGRSFALVGQSYRVLMQDKELLVLPLCSGIVIITAIVVIAFGFGFTRVSIKTPSPAMYIPVFVMYVITYAIGIFFQAAVVAGATERMRGGDPTIGSALNAASRRLPQILMWAVVAATVGTLLRAIQDRLAFVGKIVAGLLGAAWSLATFFVVPVLVLEDVTVSESFGRSVGIFKKTWGETMAGGITLGAAAVCAWLTLVALTGLTAYLIGITAIALFVLGAVALMVFFSAIEGVYIAALYRYATDGQVAPGFDRALLADAFQPKSR